MPKPPGRYKNRADYTPAEIVEAQSVSRRGEPFKVETDEYRAYRNAALEAAGLEPDRELGEIPLEEMTPEQHIERMRRR